MKLLNIIVPCFNEEAALPLFYDKIMTVLSTMQSIDYELLFVNDGSKDKTLSILQSLSESNGKVKYISFARNFGKESAIYAGLCNSQGDYTVVMDADMQDPPELLPEMVSIMESGEYDSVATRRSDRKGEPPVRSWFARRFYSFINKHSDSDIVDGARDYRMMSRDIVNAIVAMGESNRFSKGIYGWVGFKTYWLSYDNVERVAGNTKWSFWKLFKYAVDGIVSFSQAPLDAASYLGVTMSGLSFIALLVIVIRKLLMGDPVAGWASTICIIVFIGGVQLAVLGVIGQYIAKTYIETKNRPHYIIKDSNIDNIHRIN